MATEVTKLDPTFKAWWIEKLRSDEYTQTKGALCEMIEESDDPQACRWGHCCLGVAGDYFVQQQLAVWKLDESCRTYMLRDVGVSTYFSRSYLPGRLSVNFGFQTVDGALGRSFAEIVADFPQVAVETADRDWDAANYEHVSLSQLNDAGCTFQTIALLIERYL